MKRGIAVGVALALALAAALVGGFGSLLQSGIGAHGQAHRYAKAYAVVTGPQSVSQQTGHGDNAYTDTEPLTGPSRVPDSLSGALEQVPGVRSVVADVTFPVATSATHLDGHGWDSAALAGDALTSGQAPRTDTDVVIDTGTAHRAGLRVGSTVQLQTTGLPQTFHVSGLSDGSTAAYFADPEADRLSTHPGAADALVVTAAPGTSVQALRHAAPGLTVATGSNAIGDVENPAVPQGATNLTALAGSMGGMVLVTALLVVANLLGSSVRDRTRELAMMRAVGATPRQIRRKIVRETLKVAVPAAALGGVLSPGVGMLLCKVLISKGVLPYGFPLLLGPVPALIGALVTVLAAVAAAWIGARRTSRISPVLAVGEASDSPRPSWRRALAGALLLLVGGGLAAVTAVIGGTAAAPIAGMLVTALITATALLGPWIARTGVWLLGGPLSWLSPRTGRLATLGARASAVRLASAVTPIALAIGFAGSQLFIPATSAHAVVTQATQGLRAEQVVTSTGAGVPLPALHQTQATPGVTAATAIKDTTVIMPVSTLGSPEIDSVQAQGVTPVGSPATFDPGVTSGSLTGLSGDHVALSERVAHGDRLTVGDRTTIWLADGTRIQPTVTAIYDRDLGFGDVLLPYDVVADHSASPQADYLLVDGHAELAPVTAHYLGVHDTSRNAFASAQAAQVRQTGFVNKVIVAAVAGFVLIGLVTTLAVSTAARRRELRLLRLVGATPRQVMRTLRWETLLVLAVGTAVGAAVAAVAVGAYAASATGLALVSVSPAQCAVLLGTVATAGLLAVTVPARSILRSRTEIE